MNYNPEMKGTPVRDFLLGLKWAGRYTFNLGHIFHWKV
uniref:Uncharacterized protein n=1 Tax=Trichinella nativa TaxID=6335 RepID=A0A0V1KGT4_9BILA